MLQFMFTKCLRGDSLCFKNEIYYEAKLYILRMKNIEVTMNG